MNTRIAIDMDEVLADTLSRHLAMYNREHSDTLTKQDLGGKFIYEAVRAERKERARE
jgi:5'(3')-deoxyribonucleotidase